MTFLPGKSGNPKGRVPLPEYLKNVKKIPGAEFELRIARIMQMTKEEISSIPNDPKADGADIAIAAILVAAIKHGDATRLNWLAQSMIRGVDKDAIPYADNMEDYKKRYLEWIDQKKLASLLRDKEVATNEDV